MPSGKSRVEEASDCRYCGCEFYQIGDCKSRIHHRRTSAAFTFSKDIGVHEPQGEKINKFPDNV
jgi:hypothetical protein